MKQMLVTGGTVFVSRYAAEYFAGRGWKVFVLNRNTRPQSEGVTLIEGDRHGLKDTLRPYHFDAVLDINAYTERDIHAFLDGLGSFDSYIFISSSAVYPETLPQPFREEAPLGENRYWGAYGTNKIAAEKALHARVPGAYILRPPYLYGPMNNAYREGFVFDCALEERTFYLPGEGELPLQFFHIRDLCRFMEILLEKKPRERIFNVGNPEAISVRDWVRLCYAAAGKVPEFASAPAAWPQRRYFPFHDYGYLLDVSRQEEWMPELTSMEEGLREALAWYRENRELVRRQPLTEFIDEQRKAGEMP